MGLITIPFRSGMDESVDPRQAPPGTITLLKNAVFTKALEVRKRWGMAPLSALDIAGNLLYFGNLFVRGDSLCAQATSTGDGKVYSYIEALDRWRVADAAPEFTATWSVPVDNHAGCVSPDVAYLNGYVCIVWRTGVNGTVAATTDAYYTVFELASMTQVVPVTRFASTWAQLPRVISAGDRFVIGWLDQNGPPYSLNAMTVLASSPFTASAPVVLSPVTVTTPRYDMSYTSWGGGRIGWAHENAGAIQLHLTNTALGIGVTVTPWAFVANRLSCAFDAGGYTLNVLYNDTVSGWRCSGYDFNGAASLYDAVVSATGVGTVDGCGVAAYDNGRVVAYFAGTAHTGGDDRRAYDLANGVQTGDMIRMDGQVLSRPFRSSSGRWYMLQAVQKRSSGIEVCSAGIAEIPLPSSTGATLPALPAGNLGMRNFGDTEANAGNVAQVGTDDFLLVHGTSLDNYNLTNGVRQGIQLTRIVAGQPRKVNVLGGLSVSAGATPWWFDGVHTGDIGYQPTLPSLLQAAAGTLADGAYLVACVYEHRDAAGVLHRSAPATTSITVAAGGGVASVDMRGYFVSTTSKQKVGLTGNLAEATWISWYATDVNGSLLYRVSGEPAFRALQNNPTNGGRGTVNHTGTFPGGTRRLLYTTGGVLPDEAPPAFGDVVVHKDRIWGVSGDRYTIWFSKRMADDPTVFPGFNEALTVRAEEPVVALASHHGTLLVLGTKGLSYIEGDGPPPTGVPTDITPPRRIHADVGCKTALSVVSCAAGTFFQGTDDRIWLLSGTNLLPVGKAVEDDFAAYPTVKAAVLCEKAQQVRFVCQTSDGLAGIVMVYDLENKAWSRFEYDPALKPVHACYWKGRYVALHGTEPFIESTTSYLDDTNIFVPKSATFAWMSFASAGGWQRVRRVGVLGEYRSAHGQTLEAAIDYSASYQQTATFTEAAMLVNQGRYTVHLGSQNGMSPRSRALRLRLSETAPAVLGTGEGARWSALTFEVVEQVGLSRHGAASSKV